MTKKEPTREDCLLDGLRLAAGLMRGDDFERVEVSCVELPLERT